jgi:hypothetical protein
MPNRIVVDVVAIVMPLAVGFATVPIIDAAKRASAFIDRQPAAVKQGLTASVAAALTFAARLLEAQIPADMALWDASTVDVLVSSVFAIAIKHSRKLSQREEPSGA